MTNQTRIGAHVTSGGEMSFPAGRLNRRRFLATATLAAGALAALPAWAQQGEALDMLESALTFGPPGTGAVPGDYLGLSYESVELADPAFFAPDNRELVLLFKSLSPAGVLRLGGNSSEFCWWKTGAADQPPELPASARRADNWMPHAFTAIEPLAIDRLAGFLKTTGWTAIYGLNLGTGSPARAAEEAAYVARRLGAYLRFFQIGNEPEYYRDANNRLRPPDWNFDQYLAQWLTFAQAVIARVPEARFGGPDVGSSGQWTSRFAQEAPPRLPGKIVSCSGHYYVMGPPDDPHSTVGRLLSSDRNLDRNLPHLINLAQASHLDYRMTEGNTCYRGGKPGVSNAFCSALWAADYLLKLASFGCAGVNLHGGSGTVIRNALGGHLPGEQVAPGAAAVAAEGSFYTPIAGSREHGFSARPIFYGMKLAGLLAGARLRPVSFAQAPANAAAWAAETTDGETRLVLLNKHDRQTLRISLPSTHTATAWRLLAPDLTATADVTLAGAPIQPGKTWQPLKEERLDSTGGQVKIELPPASGAAVFFPGRV